MVVTQNMNEYTQRQLDEFWLEAELEGQREVNLGGEVRTTSETGGEKGVKPEEMDLLPWGTLSRVSRVYSFGTKKYASHNWRKGYEWSKSISALARHFTAFVEGEDYDGETGEPHLSSVVFHALSLLTWMEEHPELDNRYKKPTV